VVNTPPAVQPAQLDVCRSAPYLAAFVIFQIVATQVPLTHLRESYFVTNLIHLTWQPFWENLCVQFPLASLESAVSRSQRSCKLRLGMVCISLSISAVPIWFSPPFPNLVVVTTGGWQSLLPEPEEGLLTSCKHPVVPTISCSACYKAGRWMILHICIWQTGLRMVWAFCRLIVVVAIDTGVCLTSQMVTQAKQAKVSGSEFILAWFPVLFDLSPSVKVYYSHEQSRSPLSLCKSVSLLLHLLLQFVCV